MRSSNIVAHALLRVKNTVYFWTTQFVRRLFAVLRRYVKLRTSRWQREYKRSPWRKRPARNLLAHYRFYGDLRQRWKIIQRRHRLKNQVSRPGISILNATPDTDGIKNIFRINV